MNLRCIYCQTPFTLSRTEMLGAIISMNERHQNHYDAHCPRCRRANSISRQRMELFYPNWQEAAKQQASAPAAPPSTSATAMLKTEPLSKAKRAEAGKVAAKPTAKNPTVKKTVAAVAKKPAAKKTSSEKPAVKKAPAKGKNK
jgi:hypothetical protein